MQNIGAYGVEVKDVLEFVEYVDLSDGSRHILDNGSCQFGYRDSVFKRDLKERAFISYVVLRLHKITDSRLQTPEQPYQFKLDYKDIQQEIVVRKLDVAQISVQDVADMISAIRKRKLPDWTQIGTAGSFFKNPIIDVTTFEDLKVSEP